MNKYFRFLLGVGMSAALVIATGAVASAHVVVTPSTVQTAAWQTFTISVPNEKDTPAVGLKLQLPASISHVSPTVKQGWKVSATASSITWSGGSIGVGLRDDFSFSAQAPSTPTTLQWKAYQTYADGTVVSWDQSDTSSKEGRDTGPFSATQVVTELPADPAAASANAAATQARRTADTAFYLAIGGVLVGLGGIYLGLRRRR